MLTNLTSALTIWIFNLYALTGLAGIVLAMAIESCCIPLPSEIVMPVAGIIIGTYSTANPQHLPGTSPSFPLWLNLILVALAGATGCVIGSIAAYYIGYKGGRPLMLKYGRYILISQHDADKADQFFQRWGSPTAFFSRLLPVIRTYISLPAGIAEMPFAKFCIFTFLGSFPWCLLLAYLGTIVGANLEKLTPYFRSFEIVILVVLLVLLGLYIWRHIRNDRKARAAQSASQTPQSQQQGWSQQPQQAWGQQPQEQPQQFPPQQYPQQYPPQQQVQQFPPQPQVQQYPPQQPLSTQTQTPSRQFHQSPQPQQPPAPNSSRS